MSPRLKADDLRATCDPATLPFRSTTELAPLEGLIGQERARDATTFGVGMTRAVSPADTACSSPKPMSAI